jgi:protein involved in polysaccharide export with SLBB domain
MIRLQHSVVRLLAVVFLLGLSHAARAAEGLQAPLRTGDVLTVSLPGEASLNRDFQIDRQGKIALPEVGSMAVAGATLEKAQGDIRTRLAKSFRDLDRLTVSIKDRRLLVTVLGYVKTPGGVDLPADATIQSAISAAGGLIQGAQLDRIQVRRDKQREIVFDYKRYLDTGDVGLLPDLQPLDVVFVPASPRTGNVQIDFDSRTLAEAGDGAEDRSAIKVFGEVNKPGTFAYKQGATAIDVIMRAGGVTRYGSVEQIRIINKGAPVLFNLQRYLDSGDKSQLPDIEPGATIFIPKQLEEIRQGAHTVYVMGEVAKPGAFESKADASFIDILANAGGPTRFADTRQIRILHGNGSIETVDLLRFTEGKGGKLPGVSGGDAIMVPEKNQTSEPSWLKVPPSRAVQMIGAVTRPGRFEWSDEMSILDLIAQAGGPTARGDIAHIQILNKENDRAKPQTFDLARFLATGGSLSSLPKIRAGNVVMVPEMPQDPNDNKSQWTWQAPEQSIYVMGQVGAPGRYGFNTSLGFLDIIAAANGPTNSADIRNIRVSHRNGKGSRVSNVNLARYFETGDDKILPKVKPGDVIFVPDRNKEWLDDSKEVTVRMLGAIGKPGRYRFGADMTILDLLAEAGGPSNDALQSKIIVINFGVGTEHARLAEEAFARSVQSQAQHHAPDDGRTQENGDEGHETPNRDSRRLEISERLAPGERHSDDERVGYNLAVADDSFDAIDVARRLEGAVGRAREVTKQNRRRNRLAQDIRVHPASGPDDPVRADERDGPACSDIDRFIQSRKMIGIERCDEDAAETAIGLSDFSRQLNCPSVADAAEHRFADEKCVLGITDMHLEVLAIAQIDRSD